MVQPSPSYTVALYLEVPASQKAVASLVDTATATGAIVTGVDVADADGDSSPSTSPPTPATPSTATNWSPSWRRSTASSFAMSVTRPS